MSKPVDFDFLIVESPDEHWVVTFCIADENQLSILSFRYGGDDTKCQHIDKEAWNRSDASLEAHKRCAFRSNSSSNATSAELKGNNRSDSSISLSLSYSRIEKLA